MKVLTIATIALWALVIGTVGYVQANTVKLAPEIPVVLIHDAFHCQHYPTDYQFLSDCK